MSHSTTAARKSGGRASRARCTSSSKCCVVVDLGGAGLPAGQPLGGVVGEPVEPDALLAADPVEEEVRRDAVQPALEGAGRVAGQRAEDPDEHVLGQVLGVVRVAGQPVRQAVDPRRVGADDLVPGGRGPVGVRHGSLLRQGRLDHPRTSPAQNGGCSTHGALIPSSDPTWAVADVFPGNVAHGSAGSRRLPLGSRSRSAVHPTRPRRPSSPGTCSPAGPTRRSSSPRTRS